MLLVIALGASLGLLAGLLSLPLAVALGAAAVIVALLRHEASQ